MDSEVFGAQPSTFFPQLGRSVTIDQAALLLGVSRRTVYYRIREGRLQTIRTIGGSQRVLLSSIQAEQLFLRQQLILRQQAKKDRIRRRTESRTRFTTLANYRPATSEP